MFNRFKSARRDKRQNDRNLKPTNSLQVETLEPRMMLSTVQIFAAGSENTETMELVIDGQVAQSWSNIGGNAATGAFQVFSFETAQHGYSGSNSRSIGFGCLRPSSGH